MFFYALSGVAESFEPWNTCLSAHAQWLNLKQTPYHLRVNDVHLSLCWLHRGQHSCEPYLRRYGNALFCSTTRPLQDINTREIDCDLQTHLEELIKKLLNPVMVFSLESGSVEIAVPLTAPEKLFYYTDARCVAISNDLRFLGLWSKSSFDLQGLYELMHFRNNPGSRTIFKDIRRVLNGHRVIVSPKTNASCNPFVELKNDLPCNAETADGKSIKNNVIRQIQSYPDTTGLLFSGGVDSSLLAALAKESGRQDMALINFSFGENDPQAELARAVAGQLQMPLLQIQHSTEDYLSVLERLIQFYSHPFGDHAFLPSAIMCSWIADQRPDLTHILDGDGADTVFALPMRYFTQQKMYRRSKIIRTWANWLYQTGRLWKYHKHYHPLGRLEDILFPYYQSLQFPLDLSWMFAKKSLNGIAYHYPPEWYEQILSELSMMYDQLGKGLPDEERFGLSALIQNCCGISTAKTYDPLQRYGCTPEFPFLSYSLLTLAYSTDYRLKNENGEAKSILKKLLSQSLSRDLIYRPKKGFIPPSRDWLAAEFVQKLIQETVYHPDNEVFQLCDQTVVRGAVARIKSGIPVSKAVYGFLWLLLFTSLWLSQFKQRRTETAV